MRNQAIHQELVPLHEATAVAHHVIFDRRPSRATAEDLDASRAEMALALGAVSTIFARDNGSLRLVTTEELLGLAAPQRRDRACDWSALYIRRCDLIRAIETIKNSRPDAQVRSEDRSRGRSMA